MIIFMYLDMSCFPRNLRLPFISLCDTEQDKVEDLCIQRVNRQGLVKCQHSFAAYLDASFRYPEKTAQVVYHHEKG